MALPNGHTQDLRRPWRETPLIHSTLLSKHAGCQIFLKLETLQPSGSFKSRGIGNFLLSHLSKVPSYERSKIHFYSSSGGNAGLACVHAAITLGAPASIVVPLSTSAYMMDKIRAAGASDVIQFGASWVEADTYLKDTIMPDAQNRGEIPVYVPPFDAQDIWDGHATLIPEILAQLPSPPDALVCSVGGGGLFCGLIQGLDIAGQSDTNVLAVETHGAHSLAFSLEHGALATLPAITSIATTLGARTVARQAFEYGLRENVRSVVLSDWDAMEGCVRFADDERIMVEAACGVSLALCYGGRLKRVLPALTRESRVVVVVCGGSNVSVGMLGEWAKQITK
ncbi:serine family amino acid catabolism protein [Ophiobolus disseminans]|uniref:L-serine ammonia-lyase n=1 Tax=Ophiobolus disseminans TaxID=1469910 RepID=A0A6A6ZE80_9PLEO|nr:serine family amino acid catabolism protein [Ophiobolus disseminans]